MPSESLVPVMPDTMNAQFLAAYEQGMHAMSDLFVTRGEQPVFAWPGRTGGRRERRVRFSASSAPFCFILRFAMSAIKIARDGFGMPPAPGQGDLFRYFRKK
jgi:hypothetical protein